MLQNVIVILIISSAIIYAVYSVVKALLSKNQANCDDCMGCSVQHDIMKKFNKKKKKEAFKFDDLKKTSKA